MQHKRWNVLISLISALFLMGLYGCNKSTNSNNNNTNPPPPPIGKLVYDDYAYDTINIGTQTWTVANARVTHYGGVAANLIPYLQTGNLWNTNTKANPILGARTYWGTGGGGTDVSHADYNKFNPIFGALYNFAAASDVRIAPPGWRVPSKADFETLIAYVTAINGNSADMVAYHLKLDKSKGFQGVEDGSWNWYNGSKEGDNATGFSAIPGGEINESGIYSGVGSTAIFRSTTVDGGAPNNAYCLFLEDKTSKAIIKSLPNKSGYSIRFVKDKQ